jgi:hypothetical protein
LPPRLLAAGAPAHRHACASPLLLQVALAAAPEAMEKEPKSCIDGMVKQEQNHASASNMTQTIEIETQQ